MSNVLGQNNLARVVCTLNGISISGFGNNGSIVFEHPTQKLTYTVGGDGLTALNVMNDDTMLARVTLLATSVAVRQLDELAKIQTAGATTVGVVAHVFQYTDPSNGDFVTARQAVILDTPPPSPGREVQDREFLILLPYARRTAKLGSLNVA